MKKLLSLFLCAVLLFALTLPAAAVDKTSPLTDSELEKINRDYVKLLYDVYYGTKTNETFDEFYAKRSEIKDNFLSILYYGRCENGAPILFTVFGKCFCSEEFQVGDFRVHLWGHTATIGGVTEGTLVERAGGPVVYDNGRFIRWDNALSMGMLSAKDLADIWRMPKEEVRCYGGDENPVTVFHRNADGTEETSNDAKEGIVRVQPIDPPVTVEGESTVVSNPKFDFTEPDNREPEQSVPTTDEPDEPDVSSDTNDDTTETETSTSGEAPADTAETEDETTPSVNVTRTVVKTMDKGLTTALIIVGSAAVLIAAAVVVILIIRKKKAKAGE